MKVIQLPENCSTKVVVPEVGQMFHSNHMIHVHKENLQVAAPAVSVS